MPRGGVREDRPYEASVGGVGAAEGPRPFRIDLYFQLWNVLNDDLPNSNHIYTEVVMDENIAKPRDALPVHVGMRRFEVRRQPG